MQDPFVSQQHPPGICCALDLPQVRVVGESDRSICKVAIACGSAGQFLGPATEVFDSPKHPYTKALVSAIPSPDPDKERERQRIILQGDPPSPLNPPTGCAFHPRCSYAIDACKSNRPEFETCGNQQAACIRANEI